MLRSGAEHLERLRDGRVVYVGDERIADVTTHPAFREAAATVASIYDMKLANLDAMSFVEDGERYAIHFLQARTKDDLRRRTRGHKMVADLTHGLFGRSPDHFVSNVTGLAMNPSVFGTGRADYAANVVAYYKHVRANDHFLSYAVLPPQAARDPSFYQRQNRPVPTLQVVGEYDGGVIISGMKLVASGAIFSDEIWIGNIQPIAADQVAQAITCAVPANAPGLSLWARKPFVRDSKTEFDSPLAWRFDESDSVIMCENVKVPWERVFVFDHPARSRDIYYVTPAHCFANHQSNVRFWSKLQLIVGLALHVTRANGADAIPAVRDTLGRLAAMEATISGMIHGQIEAAEEWPAGHAVYNRRMMYAALNWCVENYTGFIDTLRELSGGGVLQMPADIGVMDDPSLRALFERFFATPQQGAADRMKLFKLVWDMVGSEFAGRHMQYEKFYLGALFTVRAHSYREAPWDDFGRVVDDLMATYGVPDFATEQAAE